MKRPINDSLSVSRPKRKTWMINFINSNPDVTPEHVYYALPSPIVLFLLIPSCNQLRT